MSAIAATSPLSRYRALLGAAGVPRLVTAGLVARLPLGMAPLATVLLLRGEGFSYAAAGAVTGCYALAGAVTAPLLGRAVDRLGQARVLIPLALVYPAAIAALAVLAAAGTGVVPLAVCAALCGAALPPVAASMRALWPTLLDDEDLRTTAYALEAALQEVFFVVGPLLVALVAAVASPTAALLVSGACCGAGTLALASTPASRRWRGEGRGAMSRWGALGAPAVVTVLGGSAAMGAAFGIVEVAMPAFAENHGSRASAGLALAAYSLGSLIGGLVAGALPAARDAAGRYLLALAAMTVVLLPVIWAPSIPAAAALLLVAGLPIAPAFASAYSIINRDALPGTVTEAFAWNTTAIVSGIAAGSAVGGALAAGPGVRAALVAAAGVTVAAPAWVAARRRTLAR
jgi:MFS family permease